MIRASRDSTSLDVLAPEVGDGPRPVMRPAHQIAALVRGTTCAQGLLRPMWDPDWADSPGGGPISARSTLSGGIARRWTAPRPATRVPRCIAGHGIGGHGMRPQDRAAGSASVAEPHFCPNHGIAKRATPESDE